jgi:hypothetical protein
MRLCSPVCTARQARDAGKPWGEELVTRYREALDRYAEMYSIGRA